MLRLRIICGAVMALLFVPAALAQAGPTRVADRTIDLAERIAGTWTGDVISDARGSSRSNVTITVERIGPNRVRISSDYPRLPTIEVPLEQAMGTILAASGPHVVLFDPSRDIHRLDLSYDDASWSGRRVREVSR